MVSTLRKRVWTEDGLPVALTRNRRAQSESKEAIAAKPTPKQRTAKPKQSVAKKPVKVISKRKPAPHKDAVPPPESLPNDGAIDAPPYLPPKNPQATFLGLPAEVDTS
jgi:hypothetical protein